MRIGFMVLILLTISACTTQATVVPTSIRSGVTAIPNIIDFSPTDKPQASSTPTAIEVTQEVISCPSAPPIRLIIQERGRVTDNSETLNLRDGPGVSFDVLTALDPRDEFVVIDGPSCDGEFAWFRVRFGTRFGWLAEGDFEDYYVEPYLTG